MVAGEQEPLRAPVPGITGSELVVAPPGDGSGNWAGGPSALLADGVWYLAYRLRRPLDQGRGVANVVARSADGVHFEPLAMVRKQEFGADSLERPALVRTPDGRWRLYVSVNTPGSKHWRVDLLEADDPGGFDAGDRRTVVPGSAAYGVKDPVVLRDADGWRMWACWHPLDRWQDADRMETRYATSADGLAWTWRGTALAPRPGGWDARGTRITSVLEPAASLPLCYYDGRASAAENYEERTGLAAADGQPWRFTAYGERPAAASPYGGHGLRYLSVVALPAGGHRLYYELTLADGRHELRTELR